MGKRGNGEGSIYQRQSDGRWVGAVTLPNGKRKGIYGATYQAAKKGCARRSATRTTAWT